jgi:hypothetical protein
MTEQNGPGRWALLLSETDPLPKTADECILLFDFGDKQPGGVRDILLEARDELLRPEPSTQEEVRQGEDTAGEGRVSVLSPRTVVARDLVERAARRVRRRGNCDKGRWYLP